MTAHKPLEGVLLAKWHKPTRKTAKRLYRAERKRKAGGNQMKRIKANIIFVEPCLGTASADPELHVSVGMQYYPDCVDWQK